MSIDQCPLLFHGCPTRIPVLISLDPQQRGICDSPRILELRVGPRLDGVVESLNPFVAIATNLPQILRLGIQSLHSVNIQGDPSIEKPPNDRL